jgi:hypothetical protein
LNKKQLYYSGNVIAGALVVSLFLMIPISQSALAVTLPSDKTWKINGNGYKGDLVISSVDSAGRVSGTVYGNEIRDGFWDEDAQKITFTRITQADDPSTFQKYTGYLFKNPIGSPGPGEDITYTLAGYFEALSGTGGTPERPLYGWYAQYVQIG